MNITVDHNLDENIKKKIAIDTEIEGIKGKIDFDKLKTGGFIKQRQKDKFTARLRVPGGRMPVEKLKKAAEVAEKYGNGYVHFSFRQSLEIPYVDYRDFSQLIAELKEVDQEIASCGPRVRVPTACSGCEYNPNGISETQKMTKIVDDKFFGERTNHKFKMSFSGCPIDCARTNEMDIGFQGAVFPEWEEDSCTGCTICASACLEDAIDPDPQSGKPVFTADKCLYCSDCIRACPTNSWTEGPKGHLVRVGGKHGRHPLNGPVVAKFITDDEVSIVIEKTIEWYRKNGEGKGRTRIGTILQEEGKMEDYLEFLREALGEKIEKTVKKPENIRLL